MDKARVDQKKVRVREIVHKEENETSRRLVVCGKSDMFN